MAENNKGSEPKIPKPPPILMRDVKELICKQHKITTIKSNLKR